MKAISLFSGAGGFEIGFERAGIETVLQAERDPWALSVLARHWPNTERVTDVRTVRLQPGAIADEPGRVGGVMEGGHDSRRDHGIGAAEGQTASGRSVSAEPEGRGALSRGNSWITGRERGYEAAELPVDLVYGGFPCQDLSVAGKRAGLGGERSGLWFEFHRVLSELRPRWAVIENVPGLLSSNQGRDFAVLLAGLDELGFDVSWAVLDAQHFGVPQRRRRVFVVAGPTRRGVEQVLSLCESCGGNPETGGAPGEELAGTLGAGSSDSQRGWRGDLDSSGAYIALDARNMAESTQAMTLQAGNGQGRGYSLNAAPLVVPIQDARELDKQQKGIGVGDPGDPMFTIDTVSRHAVTVALRGRDGGGTAELGGDQATALRASQGGGDKPHALIDTGVRRLTPLECERLMGWPDDHTRYAADGREISDSHRYRMCGNGVVAPVAEWIAHRLVAVDKIYGAIND